MPTAQPDDSAKGEQDKKRPPPALMGKSELGAPSTPAIPDPAPSGKNPRWNAKRVGPPPEPAKAPAKPAPAPSGKIPLWSGKRFGLTPEQSKRELDPRNQISWLMDHARNHPVLSTVAMALIVTILVMDLLAIIKKLSVSEWLAISATLETPSVEGFWTWEKRASALSYLTQDGKAVTDPAVQAAVSGEEKLPREKWRTPGLAGGLAAILTSDELRQGGGSSVAGMDAYVAGQGAEGLDRTRIVQTDAIRNPRTGKKTPSGVYLGEAGDFLDNFASVSNPVKPAKGFANPAGAGRYDKVPDGLQGEDLIAAMRPDDLAKAMEDYQKNGQWSLDKGIAKTVPHPLGRFSMKSNQAVIQLLETKQSTDEAMYCSTCRTESRIHDARAPFYGEKR